MTATLRSPRRRAAPVPWPISFELAFLPAGPARAAWRSEAKAAIRACLRGRPGPEAPALWTEFDDEIAEMIREVLEEG